MIPFSTLRQITLLFLLPSAGFAVDVTLEWDPNPEPDIIGYRIYYISFPGGSLKLLETGKQTQAVLSGLPAGATWLAAVTARSASGLESAFSDAIVFVSAQPSSIPAPPPAELETGDGKQPDSKLIGSSNYQQVYQFEATTSEPDFIPRTDVPAENNFLTLSSPPQSQSVFTGDTTVLGVTTASAGPVSWRWLHNGKPLPGAVSPTLTLGPVSPAEAGEYQVRITMGDTEILTEPTVLSVWPKPTLTLFPHPDQLNPEENSLEVQVSGGSLQPLSLEFSENLTDWTLLEAFQLDDQGTRTIPDPTKTARQRFYRLRAGE